MVIFSSDEDAQATRDCIAGCEARRLHKGEFKFSKTRGDIRDLFFSTVASCPFKARAIVVQKRLIYFSGLKEGKETFYEFFVKQMIRHDDGQLTNARVVIDGSGDRDFRRRLGDAIKKRVREGAVRSCGFSDSKDDSLVQLADMCAGAVARSYREDRPDSARWRAMLNSRIEDVWEFR